MSLHRESPSQACSPQRHKAHSRLCHVKQAPGRAISTCTGVRYGIWRSHKVHATVRP